MREKLKQLLMRDQVYLGIIIGGVAAASFALGQYATFTAPQGGEGVAVVAMSYTDPTPTGTSSPTGVDSFTPANENKAQSIPTSERTNSAEQVSVVASKSGTKYHLLTCPGAKQIKPENKITFTSPEAAEAAGYTKAANCKGL